MDCVAAQLVNTVRVLLAAPIRDFLWDLALEEARVNLLHIMTQVKANIIDPRDGFGVRDRLDTLTEVQRQVSEARDRRKQMRKFGEQKKMTNEDWDDFCTSDSNEDYWAELLAGHLTASDRNRQVKEDEVLAWRVMHGGV
jgi:hypothetical protein